jgi:hypothetical protein
MRVVGRLRHLWMEVELWAMPNNSLKRLAEHDLRSIRQSRLRWSWRLVKEPIFLLQIALISLSGFVPTLPTPSLFGFALPEGTVNDVLLVGLWQMEATIFGLAAVFAPLVISVASDPIDRGRMLRRYRHDVFSWFMRTGVVTLLFTGALVFLLPSTGTSGVRVGSAWWLLASFLTFLVTVGVTIVYTYVLIRTPQEGKVQWLIEDAIDYLTRTLIDVYATKRLTAWISEQSWRSWPDAVSADSIAFDIRLMRQDPNVGNSQELEFIEANPDRSVYVSDVSLHRLGKWLDRIRSGPDIIEFRLLGVLHRTLKPGVPIAGFKLRAPPTAPGHRVLDRIRGAFLIKQWTPDSFFYRTAFKDLRDKACDAARNGRVAEFELLVQAITQIATRYYERVESIPDRVFTRQELKELSLEPRTALRAMTHELGEEVLTTRSPNVLKAWLHYPQSVMESSRNHSTRNEMAAMYPWFRAANLIRDRRDGSPEFRAMVLESLRNRLLTYGQNLAAACWMSRRPPLQDSRPVRARRTDWRARVMSKLQSLATAFAAASGLGIDRPAEDNRAILAREAEWYARVVGKVLSVMAEPDRDLLIANINDMVDLGNPSYVGAMWIECARHIAGDFAKPTSAFGVQKNASLLGRSMRLIASRFSDLNSLISSWQIVLPTGEQTEQQLSEYYSQLIDMTWDEQMELVQGVTKPVTPPYRGKLGIALLVVMCASTGEIRALSNQQARDLFDLVDRTERELSELTRLAQLTRISDNIGARTRAILVCLAQAHLLPAALTRVGLDHAVKLDMNDCGVLVSCHKCGSGSESMESELLWRLVPTS